MTAPPVLETRNLHYCYPDGTPALQDVTLAIPAGKKIAVLGPNGAGKTTLLLHLNGLLKPSRGSVLLDGRPVQYTRPGLKNLRTAVQMVFHEPDAQLFAARVFQDVSFGALNLGLSQDEALRRVGEALKTVDIDHLRDKPTHFLSHGEKKRAAIAGALVMKPRVLILDEPTSGIDPAHQRDLAALLDRLNRDGVTVLISTHDTELAWQWADSILIMRDGRIACQGDPDVVFSDMPLLTATGLTQPLAHALQQALRARGVHLPDDGTRKDGRALLELLKKLSS